MKVIDGKLIAVTDQDIVNGTFLIPDEVTGIGNRAFYGCDSLKSITIPERVTSIGEGAFGRCHFLTSIVIPENVTSIGHAAFENCFLLTSIVIPEGVTRIENFVFLNCQSLTTITIPDGVTQIGAYAFCGCLSLTSITIPENVTSIGKSAFEKCRSLTSIVIPKGVVSIRKSAFENCQSLTSIMMPESIANIGLYAFENCPIQELDTPWGSLKVEELSTTEIANLYIYFYANSILKEKYRSPEDFEESSIFIKTFLDSDSLYRPNAILKFRNLFYKMRREYDIDQRLFDSMSLELTEKFSLSTWNQIKNAFSWTDDIDMIEAFCEMIEVFGLFEKDERQQERISFFFNFLQEKSFTSFQYKLMMDLGRGQWNSFLEPKETNYYCLKENIEIPEEYKLYLNEELLESTVKHIKKISGTYGKRLNDFVKENYIPQKRKEYRLKQNNGEMERKLFQIAFDGQVNRRSLHRMFDGCKGSFHEDFFLFFQENVDFILKNEEVQSNLKNIQANFEKMKKHYLYQSGTEKVSLKQAMDYVKNISFDYQRGNYELAQEVKKAGVNSQEAYRYYEETFQKNDVRKLFSLVTRSRIYEINGYTLKGELLRKDSIDAMLAGEINYTNCCQVYGEIGHNCMAHAVNSEDGGIFEVKVFQKGEWILLTESWDWQNNNVYCHDNIEGTSYFKNSPSRLQEAVAKVLEEDGKYLIERSKEEVEKYILTRKKTIEKSLSGEKEKQLEELRELENREVIRLVTVGAGNSDLDLEKYYTKSIQVNEKHFVGKKKYTLENFQPVNYNETRPWFNRRRSAYSDSNEKQYIIAGSMEDLSVEKIEPLVPIYRDERRVVFEKQEGIRDYTIQKITEMEENIYDQKLRNYEESTREDFTDYHIYLGEDWYLVYEEKNDNSIYISDLAKKEPALSDEKSKQNQEMMKAVYDLVDKYDYIEADLKEDTSYLLYLMHLKLGYLKQIGEDMSYPFSKTNHQKVITQEEQKQILANRKKIQEAKNPNLIMHHVTFQKVKKEKQ